jgi:hypothetical protein
MFMRVQAQSRRPGDQDPMGEIQRGSFQLSFNASLRVDFQGSRVTSDGGLILVRELDERLGFGELAAECLTDTRAKNAQLPMVDLLRQSVYSRLAGYEDVNDAERLAQDPSFRLIGSKKIWDRGAALPSRLQSFEAQMLAEDGNFSGLARLNRELVGKAEALDSGYRTVLDMDSTEIPVYGEQEESAYNDHFESTCFHPLLLFSRDGDCLAAKLRPGNVHSAEGWDELLLPEIERQQKLGKEVVFRADAAFAKPEIYEALESRGVKYAIRIPANENLERDVAELLLRPVGRPSHKPIVWYKSFLYKAASWTTARRVVAKVEASCRGVVPAHGVHCDEPDPAEPGGGTVLQQAGHGRAVDQRGEASGEDDPAELPPIPVERGAAMAERDRIQPGQPVATAGAAEGNRHMVIDQLAAAAGEDGRPTDQACPLLLAAVGGEPPDAAPVWKHTAADRGFAAASRVGAAGRRNQSGRRRGVEEGVSEKSFRNGANHGFLSWQRP